MYDDFNYLLGIALIRVGKHVISDGCLGGSHLENSVNQQWFLQYYVTENATENWLFGNKLCALAVKQTLFELRHDKTTQISVHRAKTQISLRIHPV